jgi:hypothetical protein
MVHADARAAEPTLLPARRMFFGERDPLAGKCLTDRAPGTLQVPQRSIGLGGRKGRTRKILAGKHFRRSITHPHQQF